MKTGSSFLFLVLIVIVGCGSINLFDKPEKPDPIDYSPYLKLWVKFDDFDTATNAETGQVGNIYPNTSAWEGFAAVKYGNGLELDFDIDNSCIGYHGQNIFSTRQGTVEFWYLSNVTNETIGYTCLFYFAFSGLSSRITLVNNSTVGYSGIKGLALQVNNDTGVDMVMMTGTALNYSTNTPMHIATVWDLDGINSTSDTFQVYTNGSLLLSTNVVVANTNLGVVEWDYIAICGRGDFKGGSWKTSPSGQMDNFKYYTIAKTNFDDRFVE
jgi:hypothetical protein